MIPEIITTIQKDDKNFPTKTWCIDFKSGKMKGYVEGLEAVKQAAFVMLQTRRYKHLIHSFQMGSEQYTLIGKDRDYAYSESKRMIADALSIHPDITEVNNFRLINDVIHFDMYTVYGVAEMESEMMTT